MMNRLTKKYFIDKANIRHNNKFDYSLVEYISTHNKVKIICPEHGEFLQDPANHLRKIKTNKGCPKCGTNSGANKISSSKEQFIEKAIIKHNIEYDYSLVDYKNAKTKVIIICSKHGEFLQIPDAHLNGKKCSKCSKVHKPTTEEFIENAKLIHGNKYNYSLVNYIKHKIKVNIICKEHGIFEQQPNNHLSGQGCPKCKESHGEREIRQFLYEKNIKFDYQKTFNTCRNVKLLPFDFYLPELNTCIEFHGLQHYKSVKWFGGEDGFNLQQKRDKIKENYCYNNNINLIIIKYNEDINILLEEKLINFILV